MKFEKISVEAYQKYLNEHKNPIETVQQLEEKIEYFKNKLVIPYRKTSGSAGYDFSLPYDVYIKAGSIAEIPTGIKVELDKNKYLDCRIRSSYDIKKGLMIVTCASVIDSDYYNNPMNEGHILEYLWNRSNKDILLKQGDRFVQGIITTCFAVEGDEFGKGEFRTGGIGSTDNIPNPVEKKESLNKANHTEIAKRSKEEIKAHLESFKHTTNSKHK